MSSVNCVSLSSKQNTATYDLPAKTAGILWVTSGSMLFRHSSELGEILENQFCFFKSTSLFLKESLESGLEFECRLFFFDTELLTRFLNQIPSPVSTQDSYPVTNANSFDIHILEMLYRSQDNDECATHTQVLLANALLSQAYMANPMVSNLIKESLEIGFLDRVINFIESKLESEISLPMLSQYLGVSESTVKRKLASEKHTFSELVRDKRVSRGATLLRAGRTPITQIADACGYKTAAHFSAAFKSVYGCTPKTFRRERRQP
ncbi:helix-turn-helix transcriptional regulator [Vibrio ishigakensis]|nr:AraC family transcriptional regulator [Vibrio ishigakensis]